MNAPNRPVAYVVTHHPRTTQTFISAEIGELRRCGHPVEVFAMNQPEPDQIRTDADRAEVASTTYLKAAGVAAVLGSMRRAVAASPAGLARTAFTAVRSAGTDTRRALWRLLHLVEAVLVWDRCRDSGITTVHAHFGQSPSTVAWLATSLGRFLGSGPTRLVVTVHCASEIEDAAETVPDLKARDASAIVAVSDHTRSQLMRRVPAELWSRLRVIRCGIDLSTFRFQPRPLNDVPTVLFVGRLATVKGTSLLVDAVARVRAEGEAVRLQIVGGGPLEGDLRRQTDGLDWVHFEGELHPAQVREQLVEADIFCLPSLDEGIPVSIMEAMAVGTPVIATAIAGVPELAVDERTALVVPAGNVEGLAVALKRLLQDPELVERLRIAARERVELLHDASANLPDLVELLTEPAS